MVEHGEIIAHRWGLPRGASATHAGRAAPCEAYWTDLAAHIGRHLVPFASGEAAVPATAAGVMGSDAR